MPLGFARQSRQKTPWMPRIRIVVRTNARTPGGELTFSRYSPSDNLIYAKKPHKSLIIRRARVRDDAAALRVTLFAYAKNRATPLRACNRPSVRRNAAFMILPVPTHPRRTSRRPARKTNRHLKNTASPATASRLINSPHIGFASRLRFAAACAAHFEIAATGRGSPRSGLPSPKQTKKTLPKSPRHILGCRQGQALRN